MSSSVRPRVAEALVEEFDAAYLKELAAEIKQATKGQWADVECKSCGQKQKVMCQVKDLPRIVSSVTALLEQAEGRPGTAGVEDAGVTLIVERKLPGAGTSDRV